MYESAQTSNSEEQSSMKPTPKWCFAKPVAIKHLKEEVKNDVPIKTTQQKDWTVGL